MLIRRQAKEDALTDELLPHENWSNIPPHDATRLQEPLYEVWTWSKQRTQRVIETHGDTTYETDEFVGSDVSVAIRCPQQPAQGLLAPVDAYLSQNALYRFGLLWLEEPASKIDVATSQLQARLLAVALCRTEGEAALPELCRRARPGQPGSSILVVPLLALESDDIVLSTLAAQWAVSGVFRTLIGTNRRHRPIIRKVVMRILTSATEHRHHILLALITNGQPLLLQVVFDALVRWPKVGKKIRPNDIYECSRNLYELEAARLLCRIASLLPGNRAKTALSRLIQDGSRQTLHCATEELAQVDVDATVDALIQRTNERNDTKTLATIITALGRYAGVDVVMHIRELSGGILTTEEVKIAAENAITHIQERASAEGGRVSLVTDAIGGELSVTNPDMVNTSPSE